MMVSCDTNLTRAMIATLRRREKASTNVILKPFGLLVELADTPDSKSGAVKSVPVQIRGGPPIFCCAIR